MSAPLEPQIYAKSDFDVLRTDARGNQDRRSILDRLRTSWAKVLHQDLSEFSNEDVFFEVGGDSITALQLVDAAFEQGIVLTVEQIFVNASLEDMALAARVIETEHGSPRQTPSIEPFSLLSVDLGGLKRHIEEIAIACCVKSGQVETAYPCTPMQEALVAVTDTTENAYVMQITCEIRPEVPIEQFRQAWLSTVRANPVLRSRICHLDGVGYVQAVIDDAIGWNNTEDDLNSFLQNDARSPIKSGDPFFRFTVVSDAQSRHFVWTLHHALCDGASVTEVFDEVSRRFTNQSVLKRPSYEQFIASISPDTTKQRNYWQQTFNQCGFNYASYPQLSRQGFEAKPSRSIRRVLELNRTTPFDATKAQLLRAAWAVLQSHYTGNEDVVFGEIMNGRASLQTFGMSSVTGPTICLVPIGLRIDPNLTVSSLLLRVREQAAELLSFEQTGIAKIRKYLAEISLSASTACDFQTLFVVHSSDFSDLTAPALQRIGLRLISGLGKSEQHPYPLVISILISTGDAVILNLEYDERVISIQHANNLIHQFQAVLTQLSEAKEETLLSSIVPFSATDLLQIKEWNQHTPKAVEKCIHQLFEEQVHRSPTAEALVSVSETLTYAEVHNISTSVALQLVNLGVGPEEFVAICFEKSVWAVIAMLAIWKAGGAYVPIDPTHPQGRKKEIANRAKVKLVLVSRSNATDFDGICEHILTLDDAPISFIRQGCGQLPSQTLLPTSSAYLLFTSGTTGKPKGVVISHSALCTGMVYQAESFGLNSKTRMLQFASYTFDASVQEIFATLVVGGTVCVPSDSDRLNNLAGIITALQVDTVVLTPTVVNLLSPELIPFVKKINMGGEPVTSDIITKWAHHVRLTNGYGPSETTVCCAMNVGLTMDTHPANIGRAIGSTMWLVQPDNHDKLSAIGCVGEIVVSGALLASGYYGDKVTTDASFIYEPDWLMDFINTESAFRTIYKTGDLARYNADGTFQYVGRKDTQVKLRGFRIELGEIEARVMEHGSSNAAVVLLPKEGNCANQIVAIVSFMQPVLTESSKLGIHVLNKSHYTRDIHQKLDSIKKHLQYTLPEYMVPSLWVVLENMPLLVSGKVDRKAIKTWVDQMDEKTHQNLIRDLYDAEEELKGSFLPGSRAYTLREIWSIVLNVAVDRIGINTSFYSLGGDSITAIQVVSKAKSRGLHLAVRDILTRKTLGAVLPVILENTNDIHKDILHQPPDGQFDLSPIQKLFVASNYGVLPDSRYHQAMILRLRRPELVERIEKAVSAVVQKHPMLRTVFPSKHRWQKQVIRENLNNSYRYKNHGMVVASDWGVIFDKGHESLSMDTGPVFSVDVYQTLNDTFLFFAAHHLNVDLVSWRVIVQDIEEHVTGGSLSTGTGLSFFQWTKVLGSSFEPRKENRENLLRLDEQGIEDLLGSFNSTHNTHSQITQAHWNLDQEVTAELLRLTGQNDIIRPIEVMIAAIAKSFTQVFQRKCPSIFVEGHGREPLDSSIDLSSTVGWFTILYPISNFPTEDGDLIDYIRCVRAAQKLHPDNGLDYFSRKILSATNKSQLCESAWPIQFNYQGIYQQFENKTSLFEWVDHPGLEDTLIGPKIKRMGIFEIEAAIRGGQLGFSISFPRQLSCAAQVLDWFQQVKLTLEGLKCLRLESLGVKQESDLDFKDEVSWSQTDQQLRSLLKEEDSTTFQVEAVYPCSPMQREILLQQRMDPSVFLVSWEIELRDISAQQKLHVDMVINSWKKIVFRHPILRSRFLEASSEGRDYQQVVLRGIEPDIIIDKDIQDFKTNKDWPDAVSLHQCRFPHRARFLQHGNAVIGYIEANHAILDGWSVGLLQEELLETIYDTEDSARSVKDDQAPPYQSFISTHSYDRVSQDVDYWRTVLSNQKPSILAFPLDFGPKDVDGEDLARTIVRLPRIGTDSLNTFAANHDLTFASIFEAAWAQTLSIYTRSSQVAFGYIVSGRDQDGVPHAPRIIGPLINILPYHLRNVSTERSPKVLADLATRIQEQRVQDGSHSFCRIQDVLEQYFGTHRLFNTAVNFQRRASSLEKGHLAIRDLERLKDPWSVQVEFNAQQMNSDAMKKVVETFKDGLQLAIAQ
ncbi:hypothetical protein TruAng_001128 [Truncatella angustata]|nr:hypothetical protein TruAng_001128 [Truncatella angustata]